MNIVDFTDAEILRSLELLRAEWDRRKDAGEGLAGSIDEAKKNVEWGKRAMPFLYSSEN